MTVVQRIFGFLNSQSIQNNKIVVDDKYLNQLLKFENNASDVNHIVLSLYNSFIEENISTNKRALPPEIDLKISHNNVIGYKLLIEANYSENGFYLEAAYEALEYDTPGKKKFFLNYINMLYLSVLGELMKKNTNVDKMELIRANADHILVQIINTLLLKISNNSNSLEHISSECIEYNVISIVCHAFVECKVLENPNKQ